MIKNPISLEIKIVFSWRFPESREISFKLIEEQVDID